MPVHSRTQIIIIKKRFFVLVIRNAYRAEIATFVSPTLGDTASSERIRERIEFVSNILFLIEDLHLAIGPGYMTNQASAKINVRSPLYWVRNQLANHLKELMIAKKTGWQVLKNLKNHVYKTFFKGRSFLLFCLNKFNCLLFNDQG